MNKKGFLLLYLLLGCVVWTHAQTTAFQLKFNETPLTDVFKTLENNYDLLFSYRPQDIENVYCTVKLTTSNLEEALQGILRSSNLNFEIIDQKYILIKAAVQREAVVKTQASKISICGKVIDAYTNEVLPLANIQVIGTTVGTSADVSGKFDLAYPFTDSTKLKISYVGYQNKVVKWTAFKKKGCPSIRIDNYILEDDFIVVTDYLSDGIDLTDNGQSIRLDMTKLNSLPGQAEPDVLGAAQFLPGISSPGGRASDIYIRGCTPDQNLIVWENIPIYHSAHYFGMISSFNPFIIEKMEVYRGSFGAAYGGRIAGVIDLVSGNEKSPRSYWGIGTNMTHAYLYGHQALPTKKPASISFSLRRSFSELWRSPTFNNITKFNQQGLLLGKKEVESLPQNIRISDDFNFVDGHLKFAAELSQKDRIEISSLYAFNKFTDEIIDDQQERTQQDSLDLNNFGLSFNWERNWSKRWSTKLVAVHNAYDYNYDFVLRRFNQLNPRLSGVKKNEIRDRQLQIAANYRNDKKQVFGIGYQMFLYDIAYKIEEKSNSQRNEIDESDRANSVLHTVYTEFKNPIGRKLGINLGLRTNYFAAEEKFYFEPRIKLAFQATKNLSFHSNFGRYHQFISQLSVFRGNESGISTNVWSLTGQPGVPVLKSDLLQLGLVFEKGGWIIDFQAYQRNIAGISNRTAEVELTEDEEDKTIIGSTDVQGLDILLKKQLPNFRTWLSYSLSKIDFNFRRLTVENFPANYDQRHILQWNNQFYLGAFTVGLGFKYSTGVPYSVMVDFDVVPNPDSEDPNFQAIYDGIHNHRLNSTHELNLSLLYQIRSKTPRKWNGFISLSIANLLNRENINTRTYYLDTPVNEPPIIRFLDKSNLRITPNLSFRIEW